MKKGTSYIVVAAMMMGLMLTGCGGNDNSVTRLQLKLRQKQQQRSRILKHRTLQMILRTVRSPLMRRTQRKIQRTVKRQKLILQ